ncbi:precorrin-8X methylmutase [Acidaminobacter sp. JC074]|uniref:precorrin-8X methylmutase n=1 Tax=Acidaminobacter sp. JC074 TaxID=2530199 RepID=UPI001F0F8AE9|nr:precorrin-8X methylmutase [Acidaminobacter sp. JC074]MCH4888270.1 precorrin-8X methylmutase [Acidaminobacter sp. JC074]
MNYIKNPMMIEEKSFDIIGEEGKELLKDFTKEELMIVKRIIHTTADFEYAKLTEIHPKAIEAAKKALRNGHHIYADTSMIMMGVNRRKLKEFDVSVLNYVHDEDVYETAEKEGITRSMAGIKKACKDDKVKIFAIGNAPTAIFQLKELIEAGYPKPDLIIGVPVGFVGADESKEILSDMDVPYIRVNGRKGGSPVAVAIINAIFKMI